MWRNLVDHTENTPGCELRGDDDGEAHNPVAGEGNTNCQGDFVLLEMLALSLRRTSQQGW